VILKESSQCPRRPGQALHCDLTWRRFCGTLGRSPERRPVLALSAADTISPAVNRTKDFLFRPFELGTYLKLCLVAVITEGLGGNFNSSFPGGGGGHRGHPQPQPHPTHMPSPELIAIIIACVALAIVLAIAIYYLITRLRFAFFHCLITQTKQIGPGWRLYRNQANRYFVLNLVIGIIFLIMLGVIIAPFAIGIVQVFRTSGGHPDFASLIGYILPLIPIVILAILIGVAIEIVLRDFMMPHMAIENASAGEAWAAARAHIAAETGNFVLYTLLRIVLPIVGMVALFIVLLIPGLVVLGISAAVFFGLHSAMTQGGGAEALSILLGVIVGLIAFCLLVFIGVFFGGPLSVWVRTYALMFYGGRYQALGDILEAGPAGAPVTSY